MARIRTIKPEFFKHYELYKAEVESKMPLRVAYAGLWTVADREGRFKWKPEEMKTDILPHDKVNFSLVMDELSKRGFIVKYSAGNKVYGYIPSWQDHQTINIRESKSNIPPPTEDVKQDTCTHVHTHVRNEAVNESNVQAHGEGKGREGEQERKGKEEEGKTPLPPEGDEALRFDQIRKGYLGNANGFEVEYEKFSKKNIVTAELLEKMEAALDKEKKHKLWLKSTGKHCPPWAHFSTWINQKRWEQKLDAEFEKLYAENPDFEVQIPFPVDPELLSSCLVLYRSFCTEVLKIPEPKIEPEDENELAKVIGYLASVIPKDQTVEDNLKFIFTKWKQLPAYLQGFIRPDQIYKNLPNILNAFKNGQSSKTNWDDYATRVMQR